MTKFYTVLAILFAMLWLVGGCIFSPKSGAYTVYYYTTYDLSDLGNIKGQDSLPDVDYTAICRIPTHGQTYWEQEFRYEDSVKSWKLYEIRMHKISGDTLFRVEKADPHSFYSDPRDPRQLLIWNNDTVFTAVLFPIEPHTEYLPNKSITIYDSTYITVIQTLEMENAKEKKQFMYAIADSIRKKLSIEGFWMNTGIEDDYAIRYKDRSNVRIEDSLYTNVYRYLMRSTNPEMFRQYRNISKYFTQDYILLQELMGWDDDSFAYRVVQKKKAKFLPDCSPVSME